jgi:hypothetical protein
VMQCAVYDRKNSDSSNFEIQDGIDKITVLTHYQCCDQTELTLFMLEVQHLEQR